ncbi:MAG: glycosyltransferase family 4 protein, partial [Desulfatitalea sp.]|nr:glycosyltransferase family 4 protein [Desulfatitalea sp.]NNK00798.1 glycosyltransferase family 4 protein [Desulfatitalea sp.]
MTQTDPIRSSRTRLTVLQMVPELEEGGVECEAVEMGTHLARHGHRSMVASQGGRMVAELKKEGSTHVRYRFMGEKSPRCLWYIFPLRRLLIEKPVNVLHLRSRVPAWVGYLAWLSLPRRRRPALITTFHGFYSVNAYSAIMSRGERVIAVSETIKHHILSHYRTPEARIAVIYGGYDDRRFDPRRVGHERIQALRSAWGIRGNDTPVIFFPGRITRLKGHALFIQSLARIRHRRWVAVCAGDLKENPGLATELKTMTDAAGLSERIRFAGYCADMPAAVLAATIVVSASIKPESFGRIAVEAAAMGRPVVASAHG